MSAMLTILNIELWICRRELWCHPMQCLLIQFNQEDGVQFFMIYCFSTYGFLAPTGALYKLILLVCKPRYAATILKYSALQILKHTWNAKNYRHLLRQIWPGQPNYGRSNKFLYWLKGPGGRFGQRVTLINAQNNDITYSKYWKYFICE